MNHKTIFLHAAILLAAVNLANSESKNTAAVPFPPILIADFSNNKPKTLAGDGTIGAWVLDSKDPGQACRVSTAAIEENGEVKPCLAIDYKLESEAPFRAKAGVWMSVGRQDLSDYNTLEVEIKGDKDLGFPGSMRIEIKRPNPKDPREMIWGGWQADGISSKWKNVKVPLSQICGITDWSDIRQIVLTFIDNISDKKKGRVYVGRIAFTKIGGAKPWAESVYETKIKKTKSEVKGRQWAELQIKRLLGFPKRSVVKKEFSGDSKKMLREMARDVWKFFEAAVDKETGMPLDNIRLSLPEPMGSDTQVGDYTNITNLGLYMACLPAAEDLGFITRAEAEKRALLVLDSLGKMETYKGLYYNYYDTTTRERTTNFISSVDTGWLMAGLIMLRNSYPGQVAKLATNMIGNIDLGFFYDPSEKELYHGYYANTGAYSNYHYGVFYAEARIVSYLGIAKGDIPEEHWFALSRVFPVEWKWQSQAPENRKITQVLGHKFFSGNYVWNGKPIVPSWGGSMFEALLPPVFLDEARLSPQGWGLNDLRHAKAQIDYAKQLGYLVWGMSPSSDPKITYNEFGVKPVGIKGYGNGIVTPHATFLALPFVFDEAVSNLKEFIKHYPNIYGEYGFYDAVDPISGVIVYRYLALDQAMSFLGLANALNPGKLHDRFYSDPIVKKGEKLLRSENPLPN